MFERKYITAFVKGCENEIDLLGAKTNFRVIVNKIVTNAVKGGSWFSFCTRVSDAQTDVMKFKNESGVTLGSMVASSYPDTVYRSAVYKYLLLDYLCYVELPSVKRDMEGSGYKNSFDKFLATSNVEVVANWMGISPEEADQTYGSRVSACVEDNESDMFSYLKLWQDKQGNHKVTRPRADIDLSKSGTRVVPVFALKQGVDLLYKLSQLGYLDVSFKKDSGQERSIVISSNIQCIKDIYGDSDFFREGIQAMYNGDFLGNPNIGRGYIRVFEVGGSIYDSPTRSINYARILGIKQITLDDIDLSYINIDLNSVLSTFVDGVLTNYKHSRDIIGMLHDFEVSGAKSLKLTASSNDLEFWANGQVTLLSTTFLRELALFMLACPQWFNNYTGTPKSSPAMASSYSAEPPELSFDFELG